MHGRIAPKILRHMRPNARRRQHDWIQFDTIMQALNKPLRELVIRAVSETMCDSTLLSGGLDTSIIAAVSKTILSPELSAYTVVLDGAPAPDYEYATMFAKSLHLTQSSQIQHRGNGNKSSRGCFCLGIV